MIPTKLASWLLTAVVVVPAAVRAADAVSDEIVVTAKRLDDARDTILPSLGASKYTFDRAAIDAQPQGQDRSLVQLLLQAPGVVQDSYGAIHVRNEHANLQYRVNGVIVPESISGFGQTIDVRLADSISLLTGTLPAQYGYRTSGVINITTRTGAFDDGGDVGFYGGSRGTLEPSATVKGSSGGFDYFASGSYLRNDLGVENPTASTNAVHDRTEQYRGFAYASQILSETSRLTAFGGAAVGKFEIPNNPGQAPGFTLNGISDFDSADLDQNQKEETYYGVVAYQYAGDRLNLQVAPFTRYSRTRFSPDPAGGDLIFNGFSDRSRLSSLAVGVQTDLSYKLSDAHTLRGGIFFQNERTRSSVVSEVFPIVDGAQASDVPFAVTVAGGKTGQLYGVYVQDEWTIAPELTLNAGVRFDAVRAYTHEQQVSPRVSLVYRASAATTFHLGYARDFTPPPQELIGTTTVARFGGTTKASEIPFADAVKSEREHYLDAGVLTTVAPGLTIGVDSYYKRKKNLLDEGQFGESLVLSPFNYADGWAWGVEVTTAYKRGPLSLYGSAALGEEKGRNIVSSQFFFAPDELAYIAGHKIFTDHSQKWTASGGASYTLADGLGSLVPSADFVYGDGLRADDPAGIVPNGGKLPSYVTANFGLAQNFDGAGLLKGLSLRFDVINAFDRSYAIRDGSGVGVGAPQFGQRRAFYAGIRKSF